MFTLTTIIQHSFRSPSHSNQRRNKRNTNLKRSKTSLFADDMWLYIKNPKDVTRKLLELINEFDKLAEYKINIHKSVVSRYTNNERSERKIKETTPFTIASKIIKHLGISLPKDAKDQYSKNYKMLMKQINSDTNGKIYHVLVRESVPRQVDRESRGPQGERGLEFSRRKKGQTFFLSPHSLGLYNSNVSCLRTVFGFNLLLS